MVIFVIDISLLILAVLSHSIFIYLFPLAFTFLIILTVTIMLPDKLGSPSEFITEGFAHFAKVSGYLKGAGNRKPIDIKRLKETEGIFFILAGVPLQDTGGGSRGAQIALELLRQNYCVVYIHMYDSFESIDLGLKISHPNLLVYSLNKFTWKHFEKKYHEIISIKPIGALIEFGLSDFLPLIHQLKAKNGRIGYDLLDKWDSQLGSTWYSRNIENQVISLSDVLIATANNLATDLETRSKRPVHILPNAVNLRLFNIHHDFVKPNDLPDSEFIITYIGALWGEWFDWELLTYIAKSFPKAAVMIIGDYRGQCPEPYPNLFFLGLNPKYCCRHI